MKDLTEEGAERESVVVKLEHGEPRESPEARAAREEESWAQSKSEQFERDRAAMAERSAESRRKYEPQGIKLEISKAGQKKLAEWLTPMQPARTKYNAAVAALDKTVKQHAEIEASVRALTESTALDDPKGLDELVREKTRESLFPPQIERQRAAVNAALQEMKVAASEIVKTVAEHIAKTRLEIETKVREFGTIHLDGMGRDQLLGSCLTLRFLAGRADSIRQRNGWVQGADDEEDFSKAWAGLTADLKDVLRLEF